ncbi:unnamed protein product [Rotaria socialis]|uniref:N-acetylgalactosaminide beta-1,3-galactosyltransferase n=1 Tax=Rotaria socialis TaxID=392032 RepID=A0A820N7H8_9BILA|nr:unnamed protein product [Rotaria socialis]CAF3328888.1 unnamed protein product [Rotaria socialis]CAF3445584.1 unnamed protein product [Rotaria socialis]CAF3691751.1 unnamed protein product [Rotaria socialis]CAF4229684.1 unnamed protein product [Rotaria socialis]
MLFKLNIRRRCYRLWYSTSVRLIHLIILLVITFLIVLLIKLRKKEDCWLDKYRARLFCFVLTNEENLESRGRAVYETWARRCGRFVFVTRLNSSRNCENKTEKNLHGLCEFPIENITTLPDESYSHLSDKVRASLLYFNEYYPNYDWYLKADDDTYIIVENLLRFLISTIKRYPKPVLYGYRFGEDYVSGGAGYVITREGLNLFSSHIKNDSIYSQCNSTMEDMMIGKCFEKVFQIESHENIKHLTLVGETIDQHGRERFHPLAFRLHFNGPLNKTNREWIYYRPFHPTLFGYEAISETTISFHYTQPNDMYQIHSLIYDIKLFDRQLCLVSHL